MVLNYIWIAFFVIAFLVALVKLIFLGDYDVFPALMNSTFDSAKTAFEISIGLTGVLSLWLGIMKIGEKGGFVNAIAKILSPVFVKLFPDIPKGHPVTGSIFMNFAANMLGLDNAATPLGLKAMEQSNDHVLGDEHQWTVHHSREYHDLSRADGSCPTHGCLHPHSLSNFHRYGLWHHHLLPLPADQSL